MLQGKKVRVYEHAPADGAQYDESVAGKGLVEVEYLHDIIVHKAVLPESVCILDCCFSYILSHLPWVEVHLFEDKERCVCDAVTAHEHSHLHRGLLAQSRPSHGVTLRNQD